MTTVVLPNDVTKRFILTPLTALGKPSQIQAGSLTFEVLSGLASAEIVADNEVKLITVDDLGTESAETSVIRVWGDADLGEGVTKIFEDFTLVSTIPSATGFGVTDGAVEPKVTPVV